VPPVISVTHSSGGDDQLFTQLEVYETGAAQLREPGSSLWCRTVPDDQLGLLKRLLGEFEWEGVDSYVQASAYGDWEQATLASSDRSARIVIERPAPQARPLLALLDTLFVRCFGKRYEMRLDRGGDVPHSHTR